jgi:hypothetical protein
VYTLMTLCTWYDRLWLLSSHSSGGSGGRSLLFSFFLFVTQKPNRHHERLIVNRRAEWFHLDILLVITMNTSSLSHTTVRFKFIIREV